MDSRKLFRRKRVEDIMSQVGEEQPDGSRRSLSRQLGVRDLTSFGIAAIVGAGIFSTIGKASADGGPGIIFLFLFTAVACGFAAFAYAEFATRVPVSGSAYTYSYVAFGELAAWVIGWALIMEYAIGNITVAISWSDYFTGLLSANGIHLPGWMTMDYLTASRGFQEAATLMNSGKSYANLGESLQEAHQAWLSSPTFLGLHFVADLPALLIIILITWLVYRGIKETRNASNIFVAIKLSVVALVIIVGAFYIKTDNWSPFFPEGIGGILKGVSAVFFAYIGFDAISTTAEECRNPQRDLPMGMMLTLIICTVLYVAIALVLTGLVKYDLLAVGDPLAFVFEKIGLTWISGIVALSAVVAMASVLLVFQLGQPRIWMSMSRDGLLPPAFSRIHPKYKTPSFATIVTGFVVAVPALFMNLKMVTDLCSIGTLFAFVLVCAGVLRLDANDKNRKGKFRIPYINSRFILPGILVLTASLVWINDRQSVIGFLANRPMTYEPVSFLARLQPEEIDMVKTKVAGSREYISNGNPDLELFLSDMDRAAYESFIASLPLPDDAKTERRLKAFRHKVPIWIFMIITAITTWICFRKKLSLIPVLGFLSCFYMMAELGVSNWLGFSGWLVVGLIIYFTYGIKNSKLNVEAEKAPH